MKGLQVHHLAPYRLSFDNSDENLMPLCVKHHKVVETLTLELEATGLPPDEIKFAMGNLLTEYAMASRAVLLNLQRESNAA